MILRRMRTGEAEAVLALLREAFAFMDGRIDPPSSVHRLPAAAIRDQNRSGEVWVAEEAGKIHACATLTPKPGALHVGKLAVAGAARGRGLSRALLDQAAVRARALGLRALELETRVELVENQAIFRRMGFVETGATAHAGHDRPTSLTFTRALDPEG